jgi:hypothetical protein
MGERRTDEVKRRRHTPEQIIRKLREADRVMDARSVRGMSHIPRRSVRER